MDTKELQEEIIKIRQAKTMLESYKYRRIEDLPPQLKEQISQIKIIPALTSGGIESVLTVLTYLDWAQELAQEEVEKRENPVAEQIPQNTQKEIEGPKTITDIKPQVATNTQPVNLRAKEPIRQPADLEVKEPIAEKLLQKTQNETNNLRTEEPIAEEIVMEQSNPSTPLRAGNKTIRQFAPPAPPELPFSIEELIEDNQKQINRYEELMKNANLKSQNLKETEKIETSKNNLAIEQSSNDTDAYPTNISVATTKTELPDLNKKMEQLNNKTVLKIEEKTQEPKIAIKPAENNLPLASLKPRLSLPQSQNDKQPILLPKTNSAPAEIDFGPYFQKESND